MIYMELLGLARDRNFKDGLSVGLLLALVELRAVAIPDLILVLFNLRVFGGLAMDLNLEEVR